MNLETRISHHASDIFHPLPQRPLHQLIHRSIPVSFRIQRPMPHIEYPLSNISPPFHNSILPFVHCFSFHKNLSFLHEARHHPPSSRDHPQRRQPQILRAPASQECSTIPGRTHFAIFRH